jgi:hypothetical protein
MIITSESKGHLLTFDDDKHSYNLDGERVPGVTTINKGGFPENQRLIAWKVRETASASLKLYEELCKEDGFLILSDNGIKNIIKEANARTKQQTKDSADIGSIIHDCAERHEAGQIVSMEQYREHKDYAKILSCWSRFLEWKKENFDVVVKHEEIVASPSLKIAGKIDRLARRGNKVILSDFKTSSGIYTEQFIQLAAYGLLLYEWCDIEVEGIEVVRFGKDGTFGTELVTKKKEIKDYCNQFERNLETYRFLNKYEEF